MFDWVGYVERELGGSLMLHLTQEGEAMPFVTTTDGIKLSVEETGNGTPLLFVHEFAGDQRSWETQVRYFSRRYRCITSTARRSVGRDCISHNRVSRLSDTSACSSMLSIAKIAQYPVWMDSGAP